MTDINKGLDEIRAKIADPNSVFELNDKFGGLLKEAEAKHGDLLKAGTPADKAAITKLDKAIEAAKTELARHGELKDGKYVLKEGANEAATKAFSEAEQALQTATSNLSDFRQGVKVKGISNVASDGYKKAVTEAEGAAKKIVEPVAGRLGIVKTQKNGFVAALKHNGKKMQFWSENLDGFAPRAKAFGHVALVAGAAVGLGDAIFRSKDSEGEDRSGVGRILEAVLAGGVGSAALLTGSALAR